MAQKRYSSTEKMETLWKLRTNSIAEVSQETGISESEIRQWQKDYDQIHAEFYRYLDGEAVYKLMTAQNKMVDKINSLISAMTDEKIASAPLNQLSSALGVLVDRYLRIQDAKDIEKDTDNTFRVEYYDATTGKVSDTPYWAEDDSEDSETLHHSFVWETLRQNRTRQASDNRNGTEWDADMVARTNLSDGESSLARFEADDEERDWYPD